MPKKLLKLLSQNKLIVLLLLGTLSWCLTMVKSGLIYPFGMGFWGPNGHDGIWHIALAQSLSRGSWEIPVFAGSILQNYHIGYDLFLAILHRLSSIPIHVLYFQLLPIAMALLTGILTYIFVHTWKKSQSAALWATFFVYFSGSFGWIVTIFRGQGFGGESMFWSQQAVSTQVNPPFALSLIFLLAGLICWLKVRHKQSKIYILLSILFFGLLIQIKAYAGILSLGALFVAGIFDLLRNKKKVTLIIWLGSCLLSALIFLPVNKLSNSLLVWQPFWFLETMMGLSDRLNWSRFYEAMMNYKLGNSVKLIPAYLGAFAIFWFGNLGTRVVKEILVLRWIVKPDKVNFMEVFMAVVIVAAVLLPMFFLQKGTPWNTIQFLYYALFFSSILAGIVISEYLSKKSHGLKLVVSIFVILLTLPTTISTLYYHYLPGRPPAMLSSAELEALQFLSEQPEGVVLTFPFDRAKAKEAEVNPPRPLYLYESSAYVSAFANKPVYLEDEVNLDITGYDWKSRRNEVEKFYASLDQTHVYSFLRNNNIKYIYWLKGQRATLGEGQLGITRLFENSEVDIYTVF